MNNALKYLLSECEQYGITIVGINTTIPELVIELKNYWYPKGFDENALENIQAYPYKDENDDDIGYNLYHILKSMQKKHGLHVGGGNHSSFQLWKHNCMLPDGIYEFKNNIWYIRKK